MINPTDNISRMVELKKDFRLWLVFFALYIFIYLPLFGRAGYHHGETLDFNGEAMGTYMAAGRYGLVLFRYIFSPGPHPWTGAVVAGMLWCAAIVMQCRLFCLKKLSACILYGSLSLALVQFSHQLEFSQQADAVACGMLLATLACRMFFPQPASWKGLAASVLLLSGVIGIYQTLGLYFALLMCLLHAKQLLEGGKLTAAASGLATAAGMCVLAVAVSMATKQAVLACVPVSATDLQFTMDYQRNMYNGIPFRDSLPHILLYVQHYARLALFNCIDPKYTGEWMYSTSAIALLGLLVRCAALRRIPALTRLLAAALLLFAWAGVFVSYIIMGNSWIFPRTLVAESMVFAGLWAIFLGDRMSSLPLRSIFAILSVCAFLCVKGAYYVSDSAKAQRAAFEAKLANLTMVEADVLRYCAENAVSSGNTPVLYFGKHDWHIMPDGDFMGRYPAMRFLHYPTSYADLRQHAPVLAQMPVWPAPGSICMHKGAIIINGGISPENCSAFTEN